MATKSKKTSETKPEAKCPISREDFVAKAPAGLTVAIGGQNVIAERKEFSTGSFGWYANGKIMIEIDGQPVKVQVGLNLTVVGSKELNGKA